MLKIFDQIPLGMVALPALLMTFAPFSPEPHLWEKLKMLSAGTLVRPIDIFDLFWHGIWPVLLIFKLVRMQKQKAA